jgi:hypothetical protein
MRTFQRAGAGRVRPAPSSWWLRGASRLVRAGSGEARAPLPRNGGLRFAAADGRFASPTLPTAVTLRLSEPLRRAHPRLAFFATARVRARDGQDGCVLLGVLRCC